MRISDWSSDVCSSDLLPTIAPLTLRSSIIRPLDRPSVATLRPHIRPRLVTFHPTFLSLGPVLATRLLAVSMIIAAPIMITLRELHLRQSWRQGCDGRCGHPRSEEHTSELQSLMRISYAVFCLNKKKQHTES